MLAMFLLTQFIGLFVVNSYFIKEGPSGGSGEEIPFFEKDAQEDVSSFNFLISFAFSFVIAISLFLFLVKKKSQRFLRAWFLMVVTIALTIVFNLLFSGMNYALEISFIISLVIGYFKIYRRNLMIHNLSEMLIYPGISVAFIQYLSVWSVVVLLILISIYDIWAVWKSEIMQKMVKYQMDSLKIFSGFMIPNLSQKEREKIKKLSKEKSKKEIKVGVAILGGGDVVFPIITSGIFLINFGILSAICVTIGAALGLSYIFFFGKKEKPYPAMPYITAGIFLGIALYGILSAI